MRRSFCFGLGLLGLGIVTTGGCAGEKCPSGDLDCFLKHMVIVEPTDNGAPMGLVPISASQITPSVTPTCQGTICNGACVSTSVDPHNCGGCGTSCATGGACVQGACVCPSGRSACNGACVDTQTDPAACGGCGIACLGTQYCTHGACMTGCSSGQTVCGAACVDAQTDAANCGGCGNVCGSGQSCQAGVCQCTSPAYPCGCIDAASDAQNCGGCGNVCSSGQTCSGGACTSGGSAGPPPSIDNAPPPIDIGSPGELSSLDLDFSDPNGCAPAFCTHLCSKGRCSAGFLCTRPKRDHVFQGVWRSYLGFLAEPASETETFTTGVVPVSAPDCAADLMDQVAAGTVVTMAVGVEVQIATSVEFQVASSGGGGGGEKLCSPSVATCNCSVSACSDTSGSCWYETSAGRVDCASGCDCTAAASSIVSSCCPHP